jgi:tripartite-type tricarboxylate transporter receptor subunit TctC
MSSFVSSMKVIAASIVFGVALVAPSMATAQAFPNKPVTIVVPYGPGGSNDTYSRVLAEKLSKLWNQTVLVENRPGAGSAIGSAHVAQSKPDGYTLLFNAASYAAVAAMQKQLPYDPLTALQPVALAYDADFYILTGKRVPLRTLEDMRKEGKDKTLFTTTPGVGSITHLAGLLVNNALGITTEFVHHTSGANMLADIGGGRADISYVVDFEAKGGAGTPIAVISDKRSAAFPDLPTIAEAGYPDATLKLWFGVFAPAGTPKEVVDKINRDIIAVNKAPDSAEFLKIQGIRYSELKPDEFAKVVKSDIERYTALAEKHGIRK